MGVAGFVVLVIVAATILGFMLYGLYIGFANTLRLSRRLWLSLVTPDTQVAGGQAAALPERPIGGQPCKAGAHCWEVKQCPAGARERCPAYKRQNLPCWLSCLLSSKDYRLKPQCLTCQQFNLNVVASRSETPIVLLSKQPRESNSALASSSR